MSVSLHSSLIHLCVDVLFTPSFTHQNINVLVKCVEGWQVIVLGFQDIKYKHHHLLENANCHNDTGLSNYIHKYYELNKSKKIMKCNGFKEKITDYVNKNNPIVFAGYSSGAGVSLVLAEYFFDLGYDVQEWVGFGCPRLYKRSHKSCYPFKLTCYQYGNDIVSKCLPLPFFFKLPAKIQKIGENFKYIPNWADHRLENYVNTLG